ncbi:hypothetical protein D3C74_193190 [compost metagenome]
MKLIKSNFFMFSLAMFSMFLYSIWAIVIPFNQAPDELQRYDVANFIFNYHMLPVAGDDRLIYGAYGVTYAASPFLTYIIGAVFMILFDSVFDITNLYMVHRLVSILSGTISVCLVYKICEEMNFEKKFNYFVSCLFAFVPGYAFVNSYVNQDAFSICVNLFIIYFWLKCIKNNWSSKYVLLLGVGLALCLLTYLNGYVIIPLTMLLLLQAYFHLPKKEFIKKLTLLVIPIIIISGWWFIRSYILYDGDIIGLKQSNILSEKLAVEELKPSNRQTMYKQGVPLIKMIFDYKWMRYTYKSFWGAFGYMDKWMDVKYYIIISVVHFLSIIGIMLIISRIIKKILKGKIKAVDFIRGHTVHFLLFLLILLSIALSLYYSYFSDFQPQGRYIYPALFPIVFFFCLGLKEIISVRYRSFVYILSVSLMLCLNLYCLLKVLIPNYYIGA